MTEGVPGGANPSKDGDAKPSALGVSPRRSGCLERRFGRLCCGCVRASRELLPATKGDSMKTTSRSTLLVSTRIIPRKAARRPALLMLLVLLICLAALVAGAVAQTAAAAVTPDGTASTGKGAANVSSVSFAHTTGTGTDRLMLVGVSWNCGTTDRDHLLGDVHAVRRQRHHADRGEDAARLQLDEPALLGHLQAAQPAERRHGNGDRHLQRRGHQRHRGRCRRLRRRQSDNAARDRRRCRQPQQPRARPSAWT